MDEMDNVEDHETNKTIDEPLPVPAPPTPDHDFKYYVGVSFTWLIEAIKALTWKSWLKIGLVLLLLLTFVLLLIFLPWPYWLGQFLTWVESIGAWGPVIVAIVYIICTIFAIPGSILTLGAGFIFQSVWKGTITISIGSTVGCICAFLLGRTILRGWVENKIQHYEIFKAVDSAIALKGWLVVLLLRLSPIVPFNVLNYALGLTKVGLLEYSFCSWLGMLPATIAAVYIGTTLSSITQIINGNISPTPLTTSIFIAGLLATIVVVIILSYFSKLQIQAVLKKVKENQDNQIKEKK